VPTSPDGESSVLTLKLPDIATVMSAGTKSAPTSRSTHFRQDVAYVVHCQVVRVQTGPRPAGGERQTRQQHSHAPRSGHTAAPRCPPKASRLPARLAGMPARSASLHSATLAAVEAARKNNPNMPATISCLDTFAPDTSRDLNPRSGRSGRGSRFASRATKPTSSSSATPPKTSVRDGGPPLSAASPNYRVHAQHQRIRDHGGAQRSSAP